MNAAAVAILARSGARRRLGSLAVLCGLTAVASGVVLAAAAGVHRTATVFDRYMERTVQGDVAVFASGLDGPALAERLGAVPGVRDVATATMFMVSPDDAELAYSFGLIADPEDRYGSAMARMMLVEGRQVDPAAADEVVVNEPAARRLQVGDVIQTSTITPATFDAVMAGTSGIALDGPRLPLHVVGVVRVADDLQGSTQQSSAMAFAGPAFVDRHAEDVASQQAVARVVTDGRAETLGRIRAAGGGDVTVTASTVEQSWAGTTRSVIATIGSVLLVFSAAVAIAGGLVVGAAMSRQLSLTAPDSRTGWSLGMVRRDRVVAAGLPVLAATLVGIGFGCVLAVLLSPAFPVGLARDIEVDPGLRLDPLVIGLGAFVLASGVVVWGVVAAWRTDAAATSTGPEGPRRSVARWASLREPIAAVLGARMALEPGTGRAPVPTRSALVAVTAAVAGVVGVAVFATSLHTAAGDPSSYGWTWSRTTFRQGEQSDPLSLMDAAAGVEGVDAIGGSIVFGGSLDGGPAQIQGIYSRRGSILPPVTAGRLPASASEIAVGRTMMAARDLSIGDEVSVAVAVGDPQRMTVVGEVVGSSLLNMPDWGDFAFVSNEGATALAGAASVEELVDEASRTGSSELLVRFADDVDPEDVMARLEQAADLMFTPSGAPSPPGRVQSLERMLPLFVALGGFFSVLGMVALAHMLVVHGRRRRGDLGIIRALGAVSVTMGSIIGAQSLTVVAVGLVVGLPVGVVLGRAAWSASVSGVGMVVQPVVPWAALGAVVVAAAAISVALAAWPARCAAKLNPASALAAE